MVVVERDNVYYVIKSFSDQNVCIALMHDVWATTAKNESILDRAFQKGANVILVFSINGSSKFIGYALMQSRPGQSKLKESVFYLANGQAFSGKQFDILWVRVVDLPFTQCSNLKNSLNDNKPVKVSRDGQQIDSRTGQELCKLFEEQFLRNHKTKRTEVDSSKLGAYGIPNTGARYATGIPGPHLFFPPTGIPPIGFLPPHCFQATPVQGQKGANKTKQCSPRSNQAQGVKDANNTQRMSTEQALLAAEYNPAIAIFPIDLTNISYDQYISLYNISYQHWAREQEVRVKEEYH
ncbi:YT521-B-like family protein, putative [Babesia ovis]|uniref:YT521-B-like family protein, putative n=1 Tax=Babesia ovis TaxID=5869 RepID=A0A9W5T913_BABOV|nr:YT521-B-like family protein, putative [Babesia ovis]